MRSILIILTGGTIGMRNVENTGVVPSHELEDFLHAFPQLAKAAEVDVLDWMDIPSPWMTPDLMFELAQLVEIKSADYDGIVITHGTDTLEETAYLLDLVLNCSKSISQELLSPAKLVIKFPAVLLPSAPVPYNIKNLAKG
jgi:L-asparaginase